MHPINKKLEYEVAGVKIKMRQMREKGIIEGTIGEKVDKIIWSPLHREVEWIGHLLWFKNQKKSK